MIMSQEILLSFAIASHPLFVSHPLKWSTQTHTIFDNFYRSKAKRSIVNELITRTNPLKLRPWLFSRPAWDEPPFSPSSLPFMDTSHSTNFSLLPSTHLIGKTPCFIYSVTKLPADTSRPLTTKEIPNLFRFGSFQLGLHYILCTSSGQNCTQWFFSSISASTPFC